MTTPIDRLRRHHAIEHATIAVLFERRGRPVPVVGRSDFAGFHLWGPFAPDEVESALGEALRRLNAGERDLAITNLCGTNLVATGLMAGTAALVAAGRHRRQGWSRAMVAATAAAAAAAPVGRWLQRWVTTDATVAGYRLDRIEERGQAGARHHLKVYLAGE